MKILILSTQSGDWEALYIDGELEDEGHQLGEGNAPRYWMNLAAEHKVDGTALVDRELDDEDDDRVATTGNMPANLSEFKTDYSA